ncbi:MAG: hypothetical protein B7C55_13195, partial [Actinomycetales bacterium mxb001]
MFPDALRGIALLGIILVNVPFLAISAESYDAASVATAWDRTVAFLVTMLAAGKFYIIFSFLFGYSALFILKDGSKPYRRVYRRRLIALLLIGIAHVVFFFVGDILVTYSLLGFALLLLVKRSDRALWLTALIVWIIAACWVIGIAALTAIASVFFPEVAAADVTMFDGYNAAMADGTFWQAALERLKVYPFVLTSVLFGQGLFAFVAFCLGMLAARHQFLGRLEDYRPVFRRCAIWGLAVGLPLLLVLLEIPAIVIGILIARGLQAGTSWNEIAREVLLGRSVLLLIGGLLIGWIAGPEGLEPVSPLFFDLFKGVLAMFLLEMGLLVARRLREARDVGPFLIGFGVVVPFVNAALALAIGRLLRLPVGDLTLLAVLAASGSYIVVPAVVR